MATHDSAALDLEPRETGLDDDLIRAGRVERLGPATTGKIREWVGNSNARIQPVIRMDGDDAVTAMTHRTGCATR